MEDFTAIAPLVRPVGQPKLTAGPGTRHSGQLYRRHDSPLSRPLVHSTVSAYRASPPRLVGL